jgi:muconolactone delta-isomerase
MMGGMEFLVEMTTRVPAGTTDDEVARVRGAEGVRSGELAKQGQLLRLWRPPLGPGEWRTFGLFAAEDAAGLEEVLASMPLRVWRRDVVTALAPHPNDPAVRPARRQGVQEFHTTFTVTGTDGVEPQVIDEARAGEARSTRKYAEDGFLERLWRLPGEGRALGLWQPDDAGQLDEMLAALPLSPWLRVEVTPLTEHPSDPAKDQDEG